MPINALLPNSPFATAPLPQTPAATEAAPAATAAESAARSDEAENRDSLELGGQEEKQGLMALYTVTESKHKFKIEAPKPKDKTAELTAMLVAAKGPFEVRQVLSKASSHMLQLRLASMGDSDNAKLARALLRKMERLIDRGYRKIENLNNETLAQARQKKAEQNKQHRRAQEIKQELQKKRSLRESREKAWLSESTQDSIFGLTRGEYSAWEQQRLQAAEEARLQAVAEAVAAMEIAAEAAADGEAATGDAATPAGGEGGAAPESGGAEAVADGGAEAG